MDGISAGKAALVSCVCAAFGLGFPVVAADWPALRGPDGSSSSAETGLARSWPPEGPKTLWSVTLGEGHSGPVVHSGDVFLLDRIVVPPAEAHTNNPSRRRDILLCLDLGTGQEKWRFVCGEATVPSKAHVLESRSVPSVDAERVYALCPMGDLHVVDRATHKEIWSKHLIQDFPGRLDDLKQVYDEHYTRTYSVARAGHRRYASLPNWGFTQCPALYKDLVIVAPLTEKAGLVAYEKATGTLRWTTPFTGRAFYTHVSPYATTLAGVDQIVMVACKTHIGSSAVVSGVAADSGRILWQTNTWAHLNVPIPGPLKIGDDRLFVTGGYRLGAGILKVTPGTNRWAVEYLATNISDCTVHIHTPVLTAGHIFAQSHDDYHNTDRPNNGLVCLSTEGKTMWKTGPEQVFGPAHVLAADGMLYVMNGTTGELCLFAAAPDACRPLARAKVLESAGGMAWAPMALSDGKLLVRDLRTMKCLDIRAQGKEPK